MKKPQSLEDSDLSRLYTATSLMQIDDNVMRCVHARGWGPGGLGGTGGLRPAPPSVRVFACPR